MKHYIFEDLCKKYSLAKQAKIEDEITQLERDIHMRKEILKIQEILTDAATFWDRATEQQRANFGKSQDEIENGHEAKSRSLIDFGCVSKYSWKDLPEFWKSAFLSGTVDYFSKLKNTNDSSGTEKQTKETEQEEKE